MASDLPTAAMATASAENLYISDTAISDTADPPNALDSHQQFIAQMIEDGQTDAQIVTALFRRGLQTSERSLRRRLQFWGLRRQQNAMSRTDIWPGAGQVFGKEGKPRRETIRG